MTSREISGPVLATYFSKNIFWTKMLKVLLQYNWYVLLLIMKLTVLTLKYRHLYDLPITLHSRLPTYEFALALILTSESI